VLSYKLLAKQRTATVRQRLGRAKTRWVLRASSNYMLSHSRYYTGFAIMVVALYLTSICSQLTTMAPTTQPRPQHQHLLAIRLPHMRNSRDTMPAIHLEKSRYLPKRPRTKTLAGELPHPTTSTLHFRLNVLLNDYMSLLLGLVGLSRMTHHPPREVSIVQPIC
jgi:hypothetical protein